MTPELNATRVAAVIDT